MIWIGPVEVKRGFKPQITNTGLPDSQERHLRERCPLELSERLKGPGMIQAVQVGLEGNIRVNLGQTYPAN